MCGITGIWTRRLAKDRIHAEISKAVATLRHRGPDDEGIWTNENGVALGHTRLSILDLSSLAHQPMLSRDGRHVIVFNGEIYNYKEIREVLISLGHSFIGSGDTEVVLQAFREWGSRAVEKFIGMFAIAIWDEEEQTLELVRDRIGVKPLYYGWHNGTLCFGSELKALHAFRHWPREIDRTSLGEFLQFGYIAGNRTIYKNVFKLKPGHRLTLRPNQQPSIERYWNVMSAQNATALRDDDDAQSMLEELLIDAFRYRMVSDVPVGVYLSGGIDSSLVTALLAKHHTHPIHTFTIGFSEASHDESRWAAKVAQHCGTNHTEHILEVNEALEIAKEWGSLFDEPFGDPSGIPTLLVSRLASEQVKVVLSADGGDELFSGYQVYSSVLQRQRQLEQVPVSLRRMIASALQILPDRLALGKDTGTTSWRFTSNVNWHRIRRAGSILNNGSPGDLMHMYMSYWQPHEISALIGTYKSPRSSADQYPGDPALKLALWDLHNFLPDDVLTKVDRTTMAVSIEGREPLLDHRVAEFAFSLPGHLRRGALGPKHALKSILYRYVPREIVDRPKQGFSVPLAQWLKTDLRYLMEEYLSAGRLRDGGIFDPKIARQAVARFENGDTTLASPIWFLLAFEMWRATWN